MIKRKYKFVVVGSGAGGATVARELSKRGKEVLVLERGSSDQKVGNVRYASDVLDMTRFKTPKKSKEGVILWRALIPGGSTVISCGNSTPCLEKELSDLGISLEDEFGELHHETKSSPIDKGFLSEGSRRILATARELGHEMEPMSKFIDTDKCVKCGQCVFGCTQGAKWTALEYLNEAIQNGASVLYDTLVKRVIVKNGRARGIEVLSPEGKTKVFADVVILAAGGLGTPVILQSSGIKKAGDGLFVDLLVNTYGIADDINQANEPTMALVDHEYHEHKGFILSTFINSSRLVRSFERGPREMTRSAQGLMGIMTKTADEPAGQVFPDGSVSKPATPADWDRLNEGSAIAEKILINAGADEKSIVTTRPQGAHPGGTAAIDKVVDSDLQTEVDMLFICDGSVLPVAPGMPPIITICALGKRLGKELAKSS